MQKWMYFRHVSERNQKEMSFKNLQWLRIRVGQGHVFFGGSVMRFIMRFWLGENDSKQLKMNT